MEPEEGNIYQSAALILISDTGALILIEAKAFVKIGIKKKGERVLTILVSI